MLNSNGNCALWYWVDSRSSLVVRWLLAGLRTRYAASIQSNTSARDQYLKRLAHANWSNEMFELEGNFGAFLRQTAVFEGVGKLIGLADLHQEL